jgi:hypothetical protein
VGRKETHTRLAHRRRRLSPTATFARRLSRVHNGPGRRAPPMRAVSIAPMSGAEVRSTKASAPLAGYAPARSRTEYRHRRRKWTSARHLLVAAGY